MGWLVFLCGVISQANEWEDYSNCFGKRMEISRNWTTAHFLAFYGQLGNCHGISGYAISMVIHYNKQIMRPKVP